MRGENQEIEGWLGDAAKNEIFLNGELESRDIAIATLQTELDKVRGELEEKEKAIAKPKPEPEPMPTPEPPELTPTPTQPPEPEPESEPEPIPTPKPVTEFVESVTVDTPGLLKYINSINPKSGVTKDEFDNAMTRYFGAVKNGKTPPQGDKSLLFLMAKYNFKHSGKVGRYHQFSIPKL